MGRSTPWEVAPPLSATVVEKVNLRSCGGKEAPRLVLPKTSMMRSRSTPTIPTRMETTLVAGSRETLGFGSKAQRLEDYDLQMDVPGPGDYGQAASSVSEISQNPSWGKRGMGGFASRSVRFGARSVVGMPRPGRGVPGPGAYDSKARLHDPLVDKSSASFLGCGRSGKGSYLQTNQGPAPTDYDPTSLERAPHVPSCNSAFNSGTRRDGPKELEAGGTVPGPGEYRVDVVPSLASIAASMQGNAIFKEPSRKKIARVHRDLPAADHRARSLMGDFGEEVGRECVGYGSAFAPPGPGHYPPARGFAEPTEDGFLPQPATSSFAPSGERTGVAVPKGMLYTPGPDAYDAKRPVPAKLTSASSAFNSNIDRLNDGRPGPAPGPCYYSPEVPKPTKSFLLNLKKEWRG